MILIYSAKKDRFYIGASENPRERLKKHNAQNKGFTQQATDWKIVYQKEFQSKNEALTHEKLIKNWKSKAMIRKLIQNSLAGPFNNPKPALKKVNPA